MNASFNLDGDSAKEPINKLVLSIIRNAIKLGADGILLNLDLELHLKVEKKVKSSEKNTDAQLFTRQFSKKDSKIIFALNS